MPGPGKSAAHSHYRGIAETTCPSNTAHALHACLHLLPLLMGLLLRKVGEPSRQYPAELAGGTRVWLGGEEGSRGFWGYAVSMPVEGLPHNCPALKTQEGRAAHGHALSALQAA